MIKPKPSTPSGLTISLDIIEQRASLLREAIRRNHKHLIEEYISDLRREMLVLSNHALHVNHNASMKRLAVALKDSALSRPVISFYLGERAEDTTVELGGTYDLQSLRKRLMW